MTLIINLSEELETRLKRQANARELSPEEYALDLLDSALEEESFPTPQEVVAEIRAISPNPNSIRPAAASLAEALRAVPAEATHFDLEKWNRDWMVVTEEMKRIRQENDIAEGRG